jgi:hypothetical protein
MMIFNLTLSNILNISSLKKKKKLKEIFIQPNVKPTSTKNSLKVVQLAEKWSGFH